MTNPLNKKFCDGSCGYTACGHTHPKEEWWEGHRRDTLGLVEEEHSCCIKQKDSIEYSKSLVTEASRRERSKLVEMIEGMKYNERQSVRGRDLSTFEVSYNLAIDNILSKLKE